MSSTCPPLSSIPLILPAIAYIIAINTEPFRTLTVILSVFIADPASAILLLLPSLSIRGDPSTRPRHETLPLHQPASCTTIGLYATSIRDLVCRHAWRATYMSDSDHLSSIPSMSNASQQALQTLLALSLPQSHTTRGTPPRVP